MRHKAWSSIEEVPYCFSRSSVKFQGHIALKIVEFDSNWAFPDCNSSLNSPMAMKCCTKLETAKKRFPIVFQGHPSNFKVTRDKTSPILTHIGRFRTIGRSQLSNPSDLPCFPFVRDEIKMGNQNFYIKHCGWRRLKVFREDCAAQFQYTGIIPYMRPANEWRHYIVTSSLIGFAHKQKWSLQYIMKCT